MMNMIVNDVMDMAESHWPEAHYDAEKMARLTWTLAHNGGFENVGVPYCMTVEAEAMGATVDMGSREVEPHVVQSPLLSTTEIAKLKPLDLTDGRVAVVLGGNRLLKEKGDDFPIIGNLTGPISVAGTLVDMSTLLMEMRKKTAECHQLLDFITHQLIAYGNAMALRGADAICIAEPSGTGEILGAKWFETYTLTYLNHLLDAITVPVKIVHICGRLNKVYPLLSQLHCDAFSFDAMVPLEEIKPYLSGKATMGNVNTHALSSMPPERIQQLTESALNMVSILWPLPVV